MSDDSYDDDFEEYDDAYASNLTKSQSSAQLDIEFLMQKVKERDSEITKLRADLQKSQSKDVKLATTEDKCFVLEKKIAQLESELAFANTTAQPRSPQKVVREIKPSLDERISDMWAQNDDTWRPREIKYEDVKLGERVSGGGFCIMYEGIWMYTKVAIKRIFDPKISEELKAEFANEVRLLSFLRHPNIVQLMAVVPKPPSLCLITEFLARGSLYHVLHASSLEMNVSRCLRVCRDICRGINYIHKSGIVHRDIKSYNVLVDEQLHCKICDFGMARFEKGQHSDAGGTPVYMAPELLRNENATKASDIYAVSILFWEIWSRDVPFDGLDVSSVVNKVKNGTRPPLDSLRRETPKEVLQLIKNGWDGDITIRPTIDDFYDTLQKIVL